MIQLRKHSLLYKWVYLPDRAMDRDWPWFTKTSVCPIFWRMVLTTPVFVILIVGLSPIIGLVCLIASIIKRLTYRDKPSIITQYIQAQREKVCPLVEWVDEPTKGEVQ